jgi:hypothetical protein
MLRVRWRSVAFGGVWGDGKRQPNVSGSTQAPQRANLRTLTRRSPSHTQRFRAEGLGTSCQLIVGGAALVREQLAALAGAVGVAGEGQFGVVGQFDSLAVLPLTWCPITGAGCAKDEVCQRMLAHLRLKAAGGPLSLRFDDDVARDCQMCAVECDATKTGYSAINVSIQSSLTDAHGCSSAGAAAWRYGALHNEGIRRRAMCTWCA